MEVRINLIQRRMRSRRLRLTSMPLEGVQIKKVRKKSSYFRTSPGDLRQKV